MCLFAGLGCVGLCSSHLFSSIPRLPHLKPHLQPTLQHLLNGLELRRFPNGSICFPAILSLLTLPHTHLMCQLFISIKISNHPTFLTSLLFSFDDCPTPQGCMIGHFRWNHHLLICQGVAHVVYTVCTYTLKQSAKSAVVALFSKVQLPLLWEQVSNLYS